MSKVFRGKFVAGIKKVYDRGELILPSSFSNSDFFENYIDHIVNRKWVIYMKSQFKSSTKIVEYMARYTHKSAIANSRIIAIDNNTIRFRLYAPESFGHLAGADVDTCAGQHVDTSPEFMWTV